jgi:hypothetical protein
VNTIYHTHLIEVKAEAPRTSAAQAAHIYKKSLEKFMPNLAIVKKNEGYIS